jgi:hypothetical protein
MPHLLEIIWFDLIISTLLDFFHDYSFGNTGISIILLDEKL